MKELINDKIMAMVTEHPGIDFQLILCACFELLNLHNIKCNEHKLKRIIKHLRESHAIHCIPFGRQSRYYPGKKPGVDEIMVMRQNNMHERIKQIEQNQHKKLMSMLKSGDYWVQYLGMASEKTQTAQA